MVVLPEAALLMLGPLDIRQVQVPCRITRLDRQRGPVHTCLKSQGTEMKKWIVPFAALLAVTAAATLAEAQTAIKPAVIYSTGGKFDKSFNEGVSTGVEKFK